jgi:uncharacterized membrane protein HdeD (DUF308 family)
MLARILSRFWWVLLLRGLVSVLFGVVALSSPGATLAVLVLWFGAWALVDGIFDLIAAVGGRKEHDDWWVLLLEGLLGIAFGIIAFQAPAMTTLVLLFYIAAWAVATGVMRVVLAVRLRREISGEWLLALSGLASIVFGAFMLARPGEGALALLWLIALWAIVVGAFLTVLAFRVRTFAKRLGTRAGALTS